MDIAQRICKHTLSIWMLYTRATVSATIISYTSLQHVSIAFNCINYKYGAVFMLSYIYIQMYYYSKALFFMTIHTTGLKELLETMRR